MEHSEKYNRKDWMSDDQWECAKLYADLVCGFHHVLGKFKEFGSGIEINTSTRRFATYDYDGMTRIVVLAHDRCIRAEFAPSGAGKLKIILHKRHSREGDMTEKHPTLEDNVKRIRQD